MYRSKGGLYMSDMHQNAYDTIANTIRERRAVKNGYNDKEVTEEVVRSILEDAIWAPTHGMRQPWRFIFVNKDNRPDFAKKVAQTYQEELHENRENFLNEPNAFLVVVMQAPEKQKQWDENFGATAALIQNFWLLAWEKKLGVVWRTNPHIYHPEVKNILDIGEDERVVGFIHLGYFDEAPEAKERTSIDEKFSVYKGE